MRKDNDNMRTLAAAAAALCLVAIAGCTTNTSIANVATSTNDTLEMAVGTINDSADTLGIGGTTLNVVTSFRNTLGNSAYEDPGFFSLTGPGGSIVASNASNACDQLFGYGLFPGCVLDALSEPILGQPPTYNPPDAVGGYSLGFIPTGAAAASGAYSLQTIVPINGTQHTYSATATLPSPVTAMANATGVTGFVSDNAGGGTFTIGNPARPRLEHQLVHTRGVTIQAPTEYLIVVSVTESISSTPTNVVVATVETTSTTATIAGAGDCSSSLGGSPIPCGPFNVYVINADYPMVESGPPMSHAMKPTLTGSAGTADISVSPIAAENEVAGAGPRSIRSVRKP